MAVFHSYVSLPEGSFHGILEMVFMVMVCYGECEETCIFETIEVNGETSEMNYCIHGQWHAKISAKIYVKMVAVLEA